MFRQLTHFLLFPSVWKVFGSFINRFGLILVLSGSALFFTGKAVEKYCHIFQIRANGRPMIVLIKEKERKMVGKSTQKNRVKIFRYRAVFDYQHQERAVFITKKTYAGLKPAGSIRVIYDVVQNDFVSATDPDPHLMITLLLFWAMLGGLLGLHFGIGRNRMQNPRKPAGQSVGDRLQRSPEQFA